MEHCVEVRSLHEGAHRRCVAHVQRRHAARQRAAAGDIRRNDVELLLLKRGQECGAEEAVGAGHQDGAEERCGMPMARNASSESIL